MTLKRAITVYKVWDIHDLRPWRIYEYEERPDIAGVLTWRFVRQIGKVYNPNNRFGAPVALPDFVIAEAEAVSRRVGAPYIPYLTQGSVRELDPLTLLSECVRDEEKEEESR